MKNNDKEEDTKRRESMVAMIDLEIERITQLEVVQESEERRRNEFKSIAALIPDREASDHLFRVEAHLCRQIDRILDQLETAKRLRRERAAPPLLDINTDS